MSDPIRQLKQLPWQSLFEMSALTIACLLCLEWILGWIAQVSMAVMRVLVLLYAPPLSLGLWLMGLAVGALAVYLTERMRSYLVLSAGVLWALIFCLIVTLGLKSVLVELISSVVIFPITLLPLGQPALIGILLGVFGKGRRYWR